MSAGRERVAHLARSPRFRRRRSTRTTTIRFDLRVSTREALEWAGAGRAAAPGELTPAERHAAQLAAAGHSNKEIAQALFVSVHTVEVHLSRIFAKLGIRSRAQLARPLSSDPGTR